MKKLKDEMLPEYDFSGKKAMRGKYASGMKNGYSVQTHSGKKVTSERFYVAIESDVREYFSDAKAINSALRKLIALVPHRSR